MLSGSLNGNRVSTQYIVKLWHWNDNASSGVQRTDYGGDNERRDCMFKIRFKHYYLSKYEKVQKSFAIYRYALKLWSCELKR